MTYVFEKTMGKYDSSTNFEGDTLIVEYVMSSVNDKLKVVEMTRMGENEFGDFGANFHRMNWTKQNPRKKNFETEETKCLKKEVI